MRKFLIVALALMLVLGLSGLALADNVVYMDQVIGYSADGDVDQDGDGNFIGLRQIASNGTNDADIEQIGSGNTLRGASACGVYQSTWWAWQTSYYGVNELTVSQIGHNNQIGLAQFTYGGGGDNFADITQTGDGNDLFVYMEAAGDNHLTVTQDGSDYLRVCQYNPSGLSNIVDVDQ